ncbi:MAG: Holliday junction resolvase RuvX [Cytophagales bacterium]|nr:MAG: Holliday junction resolvase RuvX [Cytophagales bacterium]
MSRLLALDIGAKRTGIAVTDRQRIIATALQTVDTKELISFLKTYLQKEEVEVIIVGMPKNLRNQDTDNTPLVRSFIEILTKQFPKHPIKSIDERFTSSIALDTMIAGGMKKKDRREKGNVDKISATLILQSYMESITGVL